MSAAANVIKFNYLSSLESFKQQQAGRIQLIRNMSSKTYYEVLELNQKCSDTQIRESFVKLSKQYHPDSSLAQKRGSSTSKSSDSRRFQAVLEAYKVLGKPETRIAYDRSLQYNYPYEKVIKVEYDGEIFRPNQYGAASQGYGFPEKPYYGTSSIKGKLSNKFIVVCCLLFTGIGFATQMAAIRRSFTFNRETLDEKSARISRTHAQVRAEAEQFGNQAQIERLKSRLHTIESD